MLNKQCFVLLLCLLLGACSNTAERQKSAFAVGEEKPAKEKILPSAKTSKTVLALLQRANQAAKAGQLHTAESQLERALRIEPRNAVLWHYLAKLRLHQNRLDEAAGMASKSNALAGREKKLRIDNWRIIGHARHQKGDTKGARAAQRKIEKLQQE